MEGGGEKGRGWRGNSTLEVGPRAGWHGEGVCVSWDCVLVCVCVLSSEN